MNRVHAYLRAYRAAQRACAAYTDRWGTGRVSQQYADYCRACDRKQSRLRAMRRRGETVAS